MGEFAAMAPEVGIKAYDEAKAAAQEIRDSIGSNWTAKELKFNFPKDPIVSNFSESDATFRWKLVTTVRYTAAYYSHIRATTKGEKRHELKAAKRGLETGLDRDDRKELRKDIEKAVKQQLADRYAQKYRVKLAAIKKTGDRTHEIAALHDGIRGKYPTLKLGGTNMSDKDFGKEMAKVITKDFESKYQKVYEGVYQTKYRERIQKAHPELDPRKVADAKKLDGIMQKATARDVMSSKKTSVVFCYEVAYQVMEVDMDEVKSRWRRLEDKLRKERKAEKNAVDAQIKTVMENLKDFRALDPEDQKAGAKTLLQLRTRLGKLGEKNESISLRYKEYKKEIVKEQERLEKSATGKKKITSFAVNPVAECGPYKSLVTWRNTTVDIGAGAAFQPDGSVRVTFTWAETGRVGIPFLAHLFDQKSSTFGSVVFRVDGSASGDGKIGERFASTKLGG